MDVTRTRIELEHVRRDVRPLDRKILRVAIVVEQGVVGVHIGREHDRVELDGLGCGRKGISPLDPHAVVRGIGPHRRRGGLGDDLRAVSGRVLRHRLHPRRAAVREAAPTETGLGERGQWPRGVRGPPVDEEQEQVLELGEQQLLVVAVSVEDAEVRHQEVVDEVLRETGGRQVLLHRVLERPVDRRHQYVVRELVGGRGVRACIELLEARTALVRRKVAPIRVRREGRAEPDLSVGNRDARELRELEGLVGVRVEQRADVLHPDVDRVLLPFDRRVQRVRVAADLGLVVEQRELNRAPRLLIRREAPKERQT